MHNKNYYWSAGFGGKTGPKCDFPGPQDLKPPNIRCTTPVKPPANWREAEGDEATGDVVIELDGYFVGRLPGDRRRRAHPSHAGKGFPRETGKDGIS